MTTTDPTSIPFTAGKLPWMSRGVIGSVVAIVAFALGLKGWHVDQTKLVDDLTQIIGLIGAILALYGRIKADQPIVWTRGTAPGGAFNPQAEVHRADPVQTDVSRQDAKTQSGYAYPGALGMLVLCAVTAGILIGCHPGAGEMSRKDAKTPRNPEIPVVHHPSSDLRPPTSGFCPPTSDLRPPTSDLWLPTSVLRPPTSGFCPLPSAPRSLISDLRPLASDLFRSLQVTPGCDVMTNRAGHSIPVVSVNITGGIEF